MLFVGVPAIMSVTAGSVLLSVKYLDKIVFETKK
jgi:hypothetical protein